ncbi:hypothetical protein [Bradyrhizobium sp. LMTR 3]|uniref:hypothetical protein n=1 Tax=Bradyrhizobium sp. LMTR 3 TaxID=189873 RepID=UPI0008109D9F|nr:hypothetical protein [Bradyrhizobium sp. LMTR 3]OCK55373.1 hypothetical protein LMTR3_11150 [Bradyrhizobium sp. LMTR 3]
MSHPITPDRRRFLGTVAATLAAAWFAMSGALFAQSGDAGAPSSKRLALEGGRVLPPAVATTAGAGRHLMFPRRNRERNRITFRRGLNLALVIPDTS